jgi:hypothetical protein
MAMIPSFDAEPSLKSLGLVCAWCGLKMTDEPEVPQRVSHGICPPCFHAVTVTMETKTDSWPATSPPSSAPTQ